MDWWKEFVRGIRNRMVRISSYAAKVTPQNTQNRDKPLNDIKFNICTVAGMYFQDRH